MEEMTKTVICPKCNDKEYHGMLHDFGGQSMCRNCVEPHLSLDGSEVFNHAYPYYEDGVNYEEIQSLRLEK